MPCYSRPCLATAGNLVNQHTTTVSVGLGHPRGNTGSFFTSVLMVLAQPTDLPLGNLHALLLAPHSFQILAVQIPPCCSCRPFEKQPRFVLLFPAHVTFVSARPSLLACMQAVLIMLPGMCNLAVGCLRAQQIKQWCLNFQPSSISCQPSSINRRPSSIHCQPSSINCQPSPINYQPSSINCQPSSINCQPSSAAGKLCHIALCILLSLPACLVTRCVHM
eukprot:303362-Pelagomonas_calceolata.AAC.4